MVEVVERCNSALERFELGFRGKACVADEEIEFVVVGTFRERLWICDLVADCMREVEFTWCGRSFIQRNYGDLKALNPSLPIL
jgi:hypothetical protein